MSSSEPVTEAGVFQLRPVESIVVPGSTTYDDHEPTCGVAPDTPCTDDLLLSPDGITLESTDGQRYVLGALVVDGSDLASASATSVSDGTWVVVLMLDPEGASAFSSATSTAVSAVPPMNQIAVIVDGVLESAPTVQAPIESGQVVVAGNFTRHGAEELAAELGGS